MIVFLDTSALIKLYIAEPGSEALQGRVENTTGNQLHRIRIATT